MAFPLRFFTRFPFLPSRTQSPRGFQGKSFPPSGRAFQSSGIPTQNRASTTSKFSANRREFRRAQNVHASWTEGAGLRWAGRRPRGGAEGSVAPGGARR